MTTETRLNGDGVPKIFIRPGGNPIEKLALEQLLMASAKGTAVTLVSDGDSGVVLSVKTDRQAVAEYAPDA